jgi:hypothetical protein
LLLFLTPNIFAQTDWYTYQERTMAELIAITPLTGNPELIISAQPFPSKTALKYQGQKRPVEGYAKLFLNMWLDSRNIQGENRNMLAEEYLFKEKDREFWMPVLRKISPVVDRELKPGDEIIGYYFFLGAYDPQRLYQKDTAKNKPPFTGKEGISWVFAFEEFDNPVPKTPFKINGYNIQSFTDAIDKKLERNVSKAIYFFDPQQTRSRSAVVYTGQTRGAAKAKMDYLDKWGEGYQLIGASVLLKEEALFRMNGKDHWLPVRKSVLEEMRKQLKEGDSISIDTIFAGGMPNEQTMEWVFVVGNFSAGK